MGDVWILKQDLSPCLHEEAARTFHSQGTAHPMAGQELVMGNQSREKSKSLR
jgi:hypothetical protein